MNKEDSMKTKPANSIYKNFAVAIYARVYEVQQMADLEWLRERFDVISKHVKVNKVYLETHRDMVVADEATIRGAQQFFENRGIQVAGGITITVNERNRFQTYCYTNPEHRQKLKEVVEYTARLFDEVILDDFFFTNCKCASCIQAKGEQSWTRFRLDLMAEAAQSLVIGPARAVNLKVKLVIKYPNWYEHFPGLGFNLKVEPQLFDGLYTGTETRDAVLGNQHLQPYLGYAIFRYFENLKPGANGGGWVDTGGMRYLDRYAEQLWLTLFARAPEVTLFDFWQLQRPIQESHRAPWQDGTTSFDFDRVISPVRQPDGTLSPQATVALAAGAAFEQVDPFLDKLGNPVGLACYKPYHSTGEDFLHNYLGMLGIPIDLVPEFPTQAPMVLLTEAAKFDAEIVEKIKRQLADGKNVTITSGLLRALQDGGLRQIVELEYTDHKASVQEFLVGWFQVYKAERPILVPQIRYLTNDSWEEISCMGGMTGYPLLHSARYDQGILYVLVIPENYSDLYHLPTEVLTRIKEFLLTDLHFHVESPSQVCLFAYANDTWIVESFRDEPVQTRLILDHQFRGVKDSLTGELLVGEDLLDWRGEKTGKKGYRMEIKPHSFRVLEGLRTSPPQA
jgi:hypothetical protein